MDTANFKLVFQESEEGTSYTVHTFLLESTQVGCRSFEDHDDLEIPPIYSFRQKFYVLFYKCIQFYP